MADHSNNVLLPFALPDTKSLRRAAANIVRDIQRDREETDQQTADNLGVSVGTIRNIRNEACDIGSLTMARIGARYGEDAVDPYHALYAHCRDDQGGEPLTLLADAMAALSRAKGPKARMDALPVVKDCIEGMTAWVMEIERQRLKVVA
jgi:3-hydroxyacyl-CoA dehydrogenase